MSTRKRILITGMSGFIGHHVAEHFLRFTNYDVIGLDRYSVSGSLARLSTMDCWPDMRSRVQSYWHDLRSPVNDLLARMIGPVDYVLHLAASSHVDRSIADPMSFAMDNVIGSVNLFEFCRKAQPDRVVYFSTDEVFGPAPEGINYKEWDRYRSTNPYSASKAGAEEFAIAYQNTYGTPIITTHTMNVFGERQHPEKFIPTVIRKVLNEETVMIHANKDRTAAGSRYYIHARNVAAALGFVLMHGTPGEKYNIVGEREIDNLALAHMVAGYVGNDLLYEMVDFHSSRPGHDLRYALDGTRLHDMGFRFQKNLEQSMAKTVEWTLKHREWL